MAKESGMRNMTVGSPIRHIILFSLPLLAGNLLQQLYNMVDSWVVGNYVSDAALAAVGTGFPVIFFFSSLFMGISTGGTVMIAQFYGGGKPEKVRQAVDTLYTAFVWGIVPVTLFAVVMVKPLMVLLRVDEAAYHEAFIYLSVVCAGLIGTIGYNLNAGILNGVGDSSSTLLFLAVSSLLNIILDLVLVLAVDLGVLGVALGTIIAQSCSWLFGLFYINRRYPEIAIHPFNGIFDGTLFRDILKIGLPAGLQMSLVSIGTMFALSKINSYGKAFTAGFNVGNKLDSLAFLPIQSLAAAITAFVGQNIGAKETERAEYGTKVTAIFAALWTALTAVVLCIWGPQLSGLFSPDLPVIEASTTYLRCIMPPYALFAVVFVLNGAMRGAGDSLFPMLNVVASLILIRVPFLYLLANRFGSAYMYHSYGIGWTVGFIITMWYYLAGKWRKKTLTDENSNEWRE